MTVGERIKNARKKKGWSQAELGKELGVSQQMIAQFENRGHIPKLETLQKIADALDTTTISLYGYDKYNEDGSIRLDQSEKELIEQYRALDALSKEIVDFVLKKETERNTTEG